MSQSLVPRAALALSLLAVTSTIALIPSANAAPTDYRFAVVDHTTGAIASYDTIQHAIDNANAGDTVTIPMNDSTPPAAYAESITVPATKTGLTLCGTVALGLCASESDPGRFQFSTGNTVFGQPPVAWQGQAMQMTDPTSTSYFPNSNQPGATKMVLSDLSALSVDAYLASGSCGGGSPRFQFGIDINGDGTKDGSVIARLPAGVTCPTVGSAWKHLDFYGGQWDVPASLGGPVSGGTRAQAIAAVGSNPVVTVNLVFDGSAGSVAWFDNERVSNVFLREPADLNCPDANSPSCAKLFAGPNTVLDPAGGAANVVDLVADRATLEQVTIQNTGSTLAGAGVLARGDGDIIANDTITGPKAPCQHEQYGVQSLAPNLTLVDSAISLWSHTGVDVAGAGSNLVARNSITQSCHSNLIVDGVSGASTTTILHNDLRQAVNQNLDISTNRDVVLHENVFGLAGATLAIPAHATGGSIDARYNHWGVYNRTAIEGTFANDAARLVDDSCYYTANDAGVVCGPTADFTFSPASPVWRHDVSFTDASAVGGNKIASWSWDTSDGATGTGTTLTHAFGASGTFTAHLIVTDSEHYSSNVTKTINVVNHAPTLASVPPAKSPEGAQLSFALQGSDADADALTYVAGNVPAGATLNAATGVFSWTPSYTQAGSYVVQFSVTDGEKSSATQNVAIDITDVPQPPPVDHPTTLTTPTSVTVLEGATKTFSVSANDPDGAAITLAVSGPAWATIVDHHDGTGVVTLAPPVGATGSTTVTVTAHTAGSTDVSSNVAVTVQLSASVSVTGQGAASRVASPGDVLSFTATVKNTGAHTDTFTITASGSTTVLSPLTLAPGASQDVTVTVPVGTGVSGGSVRVTATSTILASATGAAAWSWSVPIAVTVTLSQPTYLPTDDVSGVVLATYANGAPVVGAQVKLVETPATLGASFQSAQSGPTDDAGSYAFDFGVDVGSRAPGAHTVAVQLTIGSISKIVRATYTEGL